MGRVWAISLSHLWGPEESICHSGVKTGGTSNLGLRSETGNVRMEAKSQDNLERGRESCMNQELEETHEPARVLLPNHTEGRSRCKSV